MACSSLLHGPPGGAGQAGLPVKGLRRAPSLSQPARSVVEAGRGGPLLLHVSRSDTVALFPWSGGPQVSAALLWRRAGIEFREVEGALCRDSFPK